MARGHINKKSRPLSVKYQTAHCFRSCPGWKLERRRAVTPPDTSGRLQPLDQSRATRVHVVKSRSLHVGYRGSRSNTKGQILPKVRCGSLAKRAALCRCGSSSQAFVGDLCWIPRHFFRPAKTDDDISAIHCQNGSLLKRIFSRSRHGALRCAELGPRFQIVIEGGRRATTDSGQRSGRLRPGFCASILAPVCDSRGKRQTAWNRAGSCQPGLRLAATRQQNLFRPNAEKRRQSRMALLFRSTE